MESGGDSADNGGPCGDAARAGPSGTSMHIPAIQTDAAYEPPQAEPARKRPPGRPAVARPFLATDIGGTHARLALVRGRADGGIDIVDQCKYRCADFPGLAPIVEDFLAARGTVDDAAIGCAGLR